MINHEINVYLEPKLEISITENWFTNTINKILDALNIAMVSELGLVLTDNKVIKRLNKTYRGKDETTDVLAFCMLSQQVTEEEKFTDPPDGISHLGEILISYPQAIKQASEKKHDIKLEFTILIIHGILHLLGYDHEQSVEEQLMCAKEKEILEKLLNPS